MVVFGPVPSRRLGRSLGINNIPPKHCSYSCVYCQVGPTNATEMQRYSFYKPEHIFHEVEEKVAKLNKRGEAIDYLTFVPDGEPTLDAGLGKGIRLLRRLGIKIAVISNGSLIWDKAVREYLKLADWVSFKVDSVDESVWRRINRPYEGLELETILSGMLIFAQDFQGDLVTETMLIDGINTGDESVSRLAEFLQILAPRTAYLSIPIRPPAEQNVSAPKEEVLNRIYQFLNGSVTVANLELLTGYEGNAFASADNVVEDLLAITAVHPMRKEAVLELLRKAYANWSIVQSLLDDGKLREIEYNGKSFYLTAYHGENRLAKN